MSLPHPKPTSYVVVIIIILFWVAYYCQTESLPVCYSPSPPLFHLYFYYGVSLSQAGFLTHSEADDNLAPLNLPTFPKLLGLQI